MPDNLKKGWSRVAFGEVVRLCRERSGDPAADGFERYVGLDHLEPGDLKIRRWGNVADGTTFTNVFRAGQVLFGKRRAYQRKVAVANFDGICSGDIYVFEPKNDKLLPELLPFICQTDDFFGHAVGTSAGSLSPRTNWDSLASYEFPLPPIEEQRRIASICTQYDCCQAATLLALNKLKLLKKSVLSSVFPSVTCGKSSTQLQQYFDAGTLEMQTGPFGTVLSAKEYTEHGWPIVNPTDITDGQIKHAGNPCISEETAKRLVHYRMLEGDILLVRKGEIDKSCIVKSAHNGWLVGSDCIRLRCNRTALLPAYMLYFLQSPGTSRALSSFAQGTVMPGLNEKMLARLELNIPNLKEQHSQAHKLIEIDQQLERINSRFNESQMVRQVLLERLTGKGRIYV